MTPSNYELRITNYELVIIWSIQKTLDSVALATQERLTRLPPALSQIENPKLVDK